MKRITLIITLLSLVCTLHAQVTDFEEWKKQKQQEFNQFTAAKQKEFASFRDSLNAAYAEHMKKSWEQFQLQEAVPVPEKPEPPKPVVKPAAEAPSPTASLPVKEVVKPEIPAAPETPKPVQPIARPEKEEDASFTFQFHHTPCHVHLQKSQAFSMPNASEASAAAAWKKMSDSGFDLVADDCLRYREQLALNDWGYIELTKTLACEFLGKGTNEAVIMQIYLLVQSGYKVRIARGNGNLVPLIPFSDVVYGYSYMTLGGERYYLISDDKGGGSYSVFNEKFNGEKTPSLHLSQEPKFAEAPTTPKTFTSKRYSAVSAEVSTNKNLIEFYNNYPVTEFWNEYAKASLSKEVKKTLYPPLKKEIAGKTPVEAATILLNFVQTAFAYKTDGEQFGYERPLFGDEMFYYPYSDCEDRSILFTILVHDLLRLDIVMLEYPNHLATAVHFPKEDVSGYYVLFNGDKYVVCDPTYIGASVGDCMPQFQNTSAATIMVYE